MIEYERFRIPPDFNLVQLHEQAAYLYDDSSKAIQICPCCEKFKRQKRISFSAGTQSLTQLGEQIPLLFYFLKATSIFLFCLVIAKFGDYQICNMIENQCEIIYAAFVIPDIWQVKIPAGFKQANDALSFAQFLVFLLGIVGLKIAIKIKKYKVKEMTKDSISNRTLKLINVHKQCSAKEISKALASYKVDIVLTYRVKQLEECLLKINKLLKMKIMKKQKDGSFIQENEYEINKKMNREKQTLLKIKKQMRLEKNRLSIAFAVFESSAEKKETYKKFKKSLPARLFYKLCTCCSDTEIRGQSFTVKPADEPSDIIWVNLENPYLRTKIRRLLSIFVCIILLVFGVGTQYLFTSISNENTFIGPLISSGIVLVLNFIIVTLLEYSTQSMEHYESHTERHLTIVQKMTTFLFINISLSPLLGYWFSLANSTQQESVKNTLFANFCFSVLILAIGNISKPFPLWFSVERVLKSLNLWLNKRKGKKCILTQIEANKQFQPIEFPISTFYSLALSSLLMVCFYVNVFQILILIEMISLVIMFLVGKWMLLRVCKSPAGLARRINNLAQSLLRIVIFIYWLGKVLLNYINLTEFQSQQYDSIFGYIFRNAFGYIEFILTIICVFLLEFFVAGISKHILGKIYNKKAQECSGSSEIFIKKRKGQQRDEIEDQFQVTYANANLHLKLQDEFKKFQQSQKQIKRKQKKRQQKYFR